MNTMKLSALFAAMTLVAGVAAAQPAQTPAAGGDAAAQAAPAHPRAKVKKAKKGKQGKAEHRGEHMGRQSGGAFARLIAASKLDSLETDQKTKINGFIKQKRAQTKALREEMKTAMQQAKQTGDRADRRAAMEPVRQKYEAAEHEIDGFLKGVLKPEQFKKLEEKTADMMKKAGRNRLSNKKAQSHKTGKDGKRWDREKKRGHAKMDTHNNATSGTATNAPNPFKDE